MRLTWVSLILTAGVSVLGCSGDDGMGTQEVQVVGFCAGGGAPSADGAALIARAPGSFRTECLNGVYENTGTVQGGDFYTNTYVSRMELREGTALAAIRCTFEGPLSNPPAERDPRDVLATVSVALAVNDWGIEFLKSASDTKQDPYYISSCTTSLDAARWPFCVEDPAVAGVVRPPVGETFCVHVDSNGGLESIRATGTSTSYDTIAKKIGD